MASTKWVIDPTHSEVTFKVRHLMISTVTGSFKVFNGHAETEDEEFKSVQKIDFKADVKSIDTNNEQRDTHLKSADFFSADEHPYLEFTAESFNSSDNKITGTLKMRDTERPITLDVDFGGTVVDGYGQTKAGLTVTGKVNRKDFGLVWSQVTEAGSVVVSDEVKMVAEVQFIKQA